MTEDNLEIIPASPLDVKINGLVEDIMEEEDPSKTKDLVDLFNWNMSKKNVSRLQKLNKLYDTVTEKMIERIDTRSDNFTNSDLLDYVKTIQGAIDINTKNLSSVETPPTIVQTNNTQINLNVVDSFDRESKSRILAAVQATLKQAQSFSTDVTDTNIIEDKDVIE